MAKPKVNGRYYSLRKLQKGFRKSKKDHAQFAIPSKVQ